MHACVRACVCDRELVKRIFIVWEYALFHIHVCVCVCVFEREFALFHIHACFSTGHLEVQVPHCEGRSPHE